MRDQHEPDYRHGHVHRSALAALLVLAALFALLIAACGDDDDSPNGTDPPTSLLDPDDQAFVDGLVEDVAGALEDAGASDEDVAAARTAVEACLSARIVDGDSQEEAREACDTVDDQFFPPGETPHDSPTPGPTATPAGTDLPTPNPALAPSLTIVDHSVVRSEQPCTPDLDNCRYSVSVDVQYEVPLGPGLISCANGFALIGSAEVSSTAGILTLESDEVISPPDGPIGSLNCTIKDAADVLAADNVPVKSPEPFPG